MNPTTTSATPITIKAVPMKTLMPPSRRCWRPNQCGYGSFVQRSRRTGLVRKRVDVHAAQSERYACHANWDAEVH